MRTIPLTQGKFAIVDDDQYERLSRYKWQALRMKKNDLVIWYARRMTSMRDGPRKAIYMHRELTGTIKGKVVNHRDFDGLNNQLENLDVCSYSENNRWRRKTTNKTHSRFRGVSWITCRQRWYAGIKCNNRSRSLGLFINEIDAARAYNEAAKRLFGEFANLNDV